MVVVSLQYVCYKKYFLSKDLKSTFISHYQYRGS